MTRAHRRAHLVAWAVIGPLAAIVFVLALLLRPATPVQPAPIVQERSP